MKIKKVKSGKTRRFLFSFKYLFEKIILTHFSGIEDNERMKGMICSIYNFILNQHKMKGLSALNPPPSKLNPEFPGFPPGLSGPNFPRDPDFQMDFSSSPLPFFPLKRDHSALFDQPVRFDSSELKKDDFRRMDELSRDGDRSGQSSPVAYSDLKV